MEGAGPELPAEPPSGELGLLGKPKATPLLQNKQRDPTPPSQMPYPFQCFINFLSSCKISNYLR